MCRFKALYTISLHKKLTKKGQKIASRNKFVAKRAREGLGSGKVSFVLPRRKLFPTVTFGGIGRAVRVGIWTLDTFSPQISVSFFPKSETLYIFLPQNIASAKFIVREFSNSQKKKEKSKIKFSASSEN